MMEGDGPFKGQAKYICQLVLRIMGKNKAGEGGIGCMGWGKEMLEGN